VGVVEHLGAGHFAPDVPGAKLAEVQFILHLRVRLLDVLVGHRDGDHGDERCHGGEGDAEEGEAAQGLGLLLVHELFTLHF
jgi:hypothetical protein